MQLKGTNIALTETLKTRVERYCDKLERLLGPVKMVSASVEIGRSTRHHRTSAVMFAEINLRIGGDLLREKKFDKDLLTALHAAFHMLEIAVLRMKERRQALARRGARSVKKYLKLSPLARFRKSRVPAEA